MKYNLIFFLFLFTATYAQVGINTTSPDASSILHVESTDRGVLIPRMTQPQRLTIVNPAPGLLVYQIDNTVGFWYFDGGSWVHLSPGGGSGEFESNSGIVRNTTDLLNDSFVFGDTDLEGPGTKFFFDKFDAAFRAGQVTVPLWDNVGFGSIGMGIDNVAEGVGSISLGIEGSALGAQSIVLGNGLASNQRSISIGNGGSATGFESIVLGNGDASGDGSFAGPNGLALGQDAVAFHGSANEGALSFYGGAQGNQSAAFMGAITSGFNSIAMIGGADAQGDYSMAVGSNATSVGQNAMAIGASSEANADNSVSLGSFGVADGAYSMAFGPSIASGVFALASGNGSSASGDEAIALMGGIATGLKSIAVDGTANGENSLALMGGATNTFAGHSLAFGSFASTSGLNAIALGFNSAASGLNSVNIGADGLASGEGSIVFGNGQAQGVNSIAGLNGLANGDNSVAFNGTASGTPSFAFSGIAFADQAIALMGGYCGGFNSLAFGNSSMANANNSICLGTGGIANGINSIVLGTSSTSGMHALAAGSGSNASGDEAVALAGGTALGLRSMAINGTANGDNSLALMGGTTGLGGYSLSFGPSASATGFNSFALGESANAGADRSTAIGFGNESLGNGSIALGTASLAIGDFSVTSGFEVRAYSFGETVVGYQNAAYTASATDAPVASDHLFVVANNTPQNAMTVLKDGKVGLSRFPNTYTLEVAGNASKTTPGPFVAHSDLRLKTNIQTFSQEAALEKLLQMRGVTYEWNDHKTGSKRPEGIQYGFIAQELMKVFPENVEKDNQGYFQTAYSTYDALYVQSIKALNNKVEQLSEENKMLKAQIKNIHKALGELGLLHDGAATDVSAVKKL